MYQWFLLICGFSIWGFTQPQIEDIWENVFRSFQKAGLEFTSSSQLHLYARGDVQVLCMETTGDLKCALAAPQAQSLQMCRVLIENDVVFEYNPNNFLVHFKSFLHN